MTELFCASPVYSTVLPTAARGCINAGSVLGISPKSTVLHHSDMENKAVRRQNLLLVVRQIGGNQAELARLLKCTPGYISQLLNEWQGRGMGSVFARRVEAALGKKKGWMDVFRPEDWEGSENMATLPSAPSQGAPSARAQWLASEIDGLTESSVEAVMSLVERLKSLEFHPPRPVKGGKSLHIRK